MSLEEASLALNQKAVNHPPAPSETIEQKFVRLRDEWKAQRRHESSTPKGSDAPGLDPHNRQGEHRKEETLMTPEDFAAALTSRLRSSGVHALPEDVRAFTAEIGQRVTSAPDMEQWAQSFILSRHPPIKALSRPWEMSGRGAVIGLLCSPLAIIVAGAAWGAIDRPAPCYGGGGPNMTEGALFGMYYLSIVFGIPVLIAGTVAGAVLGACVTRQKPDDASKGFRTLHDRLLNACRAAGRLCRSLVVR